MNSHDSGDSRPNDWIPRRNVGGGEDLTRPNPPSGEESARRLAIATRRLTQVLGRVAGLGNVSALTVRHVARCLRSRFAVCAVPASESELSIAATHGYPLDMVKMLRINSGTGVIGSVYASGTPMLVQDITTVPELRLAGLPRLGHVPTLVLRDDLRERLSTGHAAGRNSSSRSPRSWTFQVGGRVR